MKRCRKSGNSVAQITGESRSLDRMVSAPVSKLPRLGQLMQARLRGIVLGVLLGQAREDSRAKAAAGDRAHHEHVLGEVAAEVLHAPEQLGSLVGRVQPAAFGSHDVDRVGLAGAAIGLEVGARAEPGAERLFDARARDILATD